MANPNLKPKSIDGDFGGVENYLKTQRTFNNGYDAEDLRKFVAAKVPAAAVARLMSNDPDKPRSVNTVEAWCQRLGITLKYGKEGEK